MYRSYSTVFSKYISPVMKMGTLFLLLVSSALSLLEVHCTANFSSSPLFLSSSAIENRAGIGLKDTKNRTLLFDSFLKSTLKDNQGNEAKWNPKLELPSKLHLRFERTLIHSFEGLKYPGSLSVLNWDNNDLDGSNPALFDGLEKLVTSLLERNNLDSLNATIFQSSHSLVTLKIDMSNLSTLPHDIFRDLINLQNISMSENNITSLPEGLFMYNRKLKVVELMDNKGNLKKLPPSLFSGFNGLEVVLLRNIGLKHLTEDLFWHSYSLKEIDLSKNNLKKLPKKLFKDSRWLRKLDLSSNHLTTLPNEIFFAADQLYLLDLSNNYITTLDRNLFGGLLNLEILKMENNGLKLVHADAFISVSNLKIAKFSHNHLNLSTGLRNHSVQVSPFRHCRYLEVLDLSHNNVSEMFSDWIANDRLRSLDLSYNNISYLETKDLQFKSHQLHVDLKHNAIKIVNLTEVKPCRPLISQCPEILTRNRSVSVDLNDNPIDCYCETYPLIRFLYRKTNLPIVPEDLNFVRLQVKNLSCNAPENLKGRLVVGELCKANLTCSIENGRSEVCAAGGACDCRIIPRYKYEFARLYLDCDRRNLTEAPASINHWNIGIWRGVAHFNFSGNALQTLPNMRRGGYEELGEAHLDFSANQIDRLDKDSLRYDICELNLNHNKLTEIDWRIVWRMRGMNEILSMRENPWSCNKEILAFRDTLREPGILKSGWDMLYFTCNNTSATRLSN